MLKLLELIKNYGRGISLLNEETYHITFIKDEVEFKIELCEEDKNKYYLTLIDDPSGYILEEKYVTLREIKDIIEN